jgi:hypothetical protein
MSAPPPVIAPTPPLHFVVSTESTPPVATSAGSPPNVISTEALATPSFKNVISTEAIHSLIVNRAVERPPHFAFAVAPRYPKASALGLSTTRKKEGFSPWGSQQRNANPSQEAA